jgi:hypothetical protein
MASAGFGVIYEFGVVNCQVVLGTYVRMFCLLGDLDGTWDTKKKKRRKRNDKKSEKGGRPVACVGVLLAESAYAGPYVYFCLCGKLLLAPAGRSSRGIAQPSPAQPRVELAGMGTVRQRTRH